MLVELQEFGNGGRLTADFCIVGGGVCGLTLAHALATRGADVLLVESGGRNFDAAAQALNEGENRGDAYAGLAATRHRQLGGTAQIWNTPLPGGMGAKYVPLDPEDLAEWPLTAEDLDPWYRRAQVLCGLGPFSYRAEDWLAPGETLLPADDDLVQSRVYQYGRRTVFTRELPAALIAAPTARVLTGATVTDLMLRGGSVAEVIVRLAEGNSATIHPSTVILATGGIENARLLLANGFSQDWLGRGFMEHPRDYSMVLIPPSVEAFQGAAFYDVHPGPDGTVISGRLAVASTARGREALPKASVSLMLRRRARSIRPGERLLRRLQILPPAFEGGYGWSAHPERDRAFDAFRLVMNLEQQPHRENRLTLGPDCDQFGVPRAVLHYRWRPEEQAGLDRLRTRLERWFKSRGLGRLEYQSGSAPDLNAHHHAGVTRMSLEPELGVVSAECRVHHTRNLHVIGSSVFPSAGFANPTLTAVALSLRLAGHLSGGLPDAASSQARGISG